ETNRSTSFINVKLVADKYAIGCHLSSSNDCCDSMAPVAKSELSASTRNGRVSSGNMRIGAEVTRVRIWSKAVFSVLVQCQMELFQVKSNSGWAKCENPSMNQQEKLGKPKR